MRHDLNLTPVPSFRNWNSNTTDRMRKCSFCLILLITNEFLLISGNKNERSINPKSHFGLTHMDNIQKVRRLIVSLKDDQYQLIIIIF